jgi:hypothetical protein
MSEKIKFTRNCSDLDDLLDPAWKKAHDKCISCRAELTPNAKFCPECGNRIA